LARLLEAELVRRGRLVEVLDGDEVRQRLTKGLGFSKEDRDENIRRIAYVARLLARKGVVAITAAISPYREIRAEARREIDSFVEVYVRCPLDVCIQRDVKGLYRKALAGEIKNLTGLGDPYEEPLDPELVIESSQEDAASSTWRILGRLEALGYLAPEARGVTTVAIPTYLVQEIRRRQNSERDQDVSRFVLEVLSRRLAEDLEPAAALTATDRAAIESRLRQLGYID
jgi:adenylyl-sulfate kinase